MFIYNNIFDVQIKDGNLFDFQLLKINADNKNADEQLKSKPVAMSIACLFWAKWSNVKTSVCIHHIFHNETILGAIMPKHDEMVHV